ncbi:GntR family transcriptional regulator [Vibrio ziniensis]|uniref:GntR family transcriptional regulator n=1 Tax=Vibrio ziniensis TaxID=2711221 RepID=A0A6G7CJ66_9VIBR|nr:GntR family transcriptional regulator [Vibrio ziniensis]QIH42088.1 GntR family transcriptional regulator [Vibrio ziniensis]
MFDNKQPNLGATPSTSEVIAKYLREAIVTGKINENAPIRQDEVAKAFNVSKIPVREALKRLEAEGLVLFQRNRGAVVAQISELELAQIFEIRVMLECEILRLAIPNMDEATLKRAEEICAGFENEEDVGRWSEHNWLFHNCLYQPAQRPIMLDMIRSLYDKLERHLRLQMTIAQGKERANQEHRQLLDICRSKDVKKAVKFMRHHIDGVSQDLYEYLPR